MIENNVSDKMPFNETMRRRTKEGALRVIKLAQQLPRTMEAGILGKQVLRGHFRGGQFSSSLPGTF